MVAERIGQTIGLVPGAPPPEESFWGVRRLFESIARRGPLVVVIDDLHWAETTLLDLIEDVVARARDAPIMVLCLARPDLLEVRPDWGGGAVNSLTILLEPLEDGETQALLHNLLGGGQLAPEIANEIIGVAAGIPLFVEEIVRRLIEDGLIVRSDDRWTSTAPISSLSLPATITMLLAARIDRLDEPERTVLDRASVVGKEFSVADVEALSPPDARRDSVPEALDALGRKEFVRHPRAGVENEETFSFRHMLIRDMRKASPSSSARTFTSATRTGWSSSRRAHRGIGGDHRSPPGARPRVSDRGRRSRGSGGSAEASSRALVRRGGITGDDPRRHARNREAVGASGGPAPEGRPRSAPAAARLGGRTVPTRGVGARRCAARGDAERRRTFGERGPGGAGATRSADLARGHRSTIGRGRRAPNRRRGRRQDHGGEP